MLQLHETFGHGDYPPEDTSSLHVAHDQAEGLRTARETGELAREREREKETKKNGTKGADEQLQASVPAAFATVPPAIGPYVHRRDCKQHEHVK